MAFFINRLPVLTLISRMLEFKQDDTSTDLILTLTESVTLTAPNYLFVFTHVVTKDVVAFVLLPANDSSPYPSRYNKFTINPSVIFSGKNRGEWHYGIYEQASAVNLDPTGLNNLEYGKLMLYPAVDFEFDKYELATSYKAYEG